MLYTTMDLAQVWQGLEELKAPREVEWRGRWLQVEVDPQGQQRLTRIISTDPADYLNPALQPGMVLY